MFALAEIVEMNRRAAVKAVKAENNFDRLCSWSGDSKRGIVLHSAKFRNTVFLRPKLAADFVRRWLSVNSQDARNTLVERFFE
jgi:hypothetical protein